MKRAELLVAMLGLASLAACRGVPAAPPVQPVGHIDLSRYMGNWYVIASIPTRFEPNSYNPVETYGMDPDGGIRTSFRFREGGFEGPLKTIHSVATVIPDTGNAEWEVYLFWVLREQYIVAWLAPDYSRVIVARDARDYTWLMARTPQIAPAEYQDMLRRLHTMGYDLSRLRVSPQRWPEAARDGRN